MPTAEDLASILKRLDGRSYNAYRDLRGAFEFSGFTLHVDHVQADPFAAPSKLRIRIPMRTAQLPAELWTNRVRRIALEDFLGREVRAALRSRQPTQESTARHGRGRSAGSGKSGAISIDAGGQAVLERAAIRVCEDWVEARIEVGLPAAGRRILGHAACDLLCETLPPAIQRALIWAELPQADTRAFVECVENQEHIRDRLHALGLVAFVANGSILPRQSGANDLPMPADIAVPFRSPDCYELTIEVPNAVETTASQEHAITGMGIPKGVTLIVGGGYHGKSTLLQALERGVYPHIPGDGRDGVVTSHGAIKIRAEDGRSIARVDIDAFISNLPGGRSTCSFSSEDASGSTSQACNIVEALELGASTLLLDEDTSATNFMVRDARMQALVSKRHEPITPFIDRVRELWEAQGVSTVLVMGGVGDYFSVADHVIAMRDYQAHDVSAEAQRIGAEHSASERKPEVPDPMSPIAARVPRTSSFDPSQGRREVKIDARGRDELIFGRHAIDLRGVAQIEDASQMRAIGYAIHLAASKWMDDQRGLCDILEALEEFLDESSLDELSPFRRGAEHPGNFARPRRFEIAAAINRLRSLRIHS